MKLKYSEIKNTYLEIKTLLEYKSGTNVENLNTQIAEDLSLWGDDNYYFLIEFIEKYNLDFSRFNYSEHFDSEGELFNPKNSLITLILIPFYLVTWFLNFFYPKTKSLVAGFSSQNA